MLSRLLRLLTFRATADDYLALGRRELWLGLGMTWLAGIGRYWDNPRVEALQKTGLGSVAYVFVLSAFLWLLGKGLFPQRWRYSTVLTFITLTSPLAFLYAIPVERFLEPQAAREANLWFLALVAAWRVALYVHFLFRYAGLRWFALVTQAFLPLCLIVAVLTWLNLERAVFDLMGGVERETTSADDAYGVLVLLTILSVYAFPALAVIYGLLVSFGLLERKERRSSP